jgi:uncharacterized metal-binding protein YceD (DUF177 family)
MKISIDEIPQTPKEIAFSESVEELNKIYSQSSNREFGFPASLEVELRYYRAAADLFFDGRISGELRAVCGRCAEDYLFRMDQPFEFVLIPGPAKAERKIAAACAQAAAPISIVKAAPAHRPRGIRAWRFFER